MSTTSPPDDLEARVNLLLLNLALRGAVAHKEEGDLLAMRAQLEEARKLLLEFKPIVELIEGTQDSTLEDSPRKLLEEIKGFRFEELEPEWSEVFGSR